ncbi:ABC transporter ATP-binding protein [Pseudomonas sp. SDI]|uniref:ABC transporter ATP-binding protein n=1 Tax=Pseudomonas sp. SDI TaxID=2170734 RepID=UPI000DE5D0D6|nr:ABC transporter ATP-binding protein [Pseudomonas sp. SDI]
MRDNTFENHLITLQNICHTYVIADHSQPTLSDISLNITRGQSYAIVGTSGSGKSTLLNIIGLLDRASSGHYRLDGFDIGKTTADQRATLRNRLIGFIFQSFNLLPRLSALDNVALPLRYRGCARSEACARARRQLERVGLSARSHHRPADLSGGQRQRVAIARALVGEPALILADEPTGNLDSTTAAEVMALLLQLNRDAGVTLVMVTHDQKLASSLDHCLVVKDGRIAKQEPASA